MAPQDPSDPNLGSSKRASDGSGDAARRDEPTGDKREAEKPPRGDSKYFSSLKPWELKSPTIGIGNGGAGGPGLPIALDRDGFGGEAEPLPMVPGVKIIRLINHGGQGSVYEGWLPKTGKRVAVKVPRARDGHITERGCAAIRKEAEVLRNLSHPNVIELKDHGEDAMHHGSLVPYLVLELVEDGLQLDEYANKHGLDVEGRVELVIDVCEAVQYINDRGRTHRDLKPQNILVNRHGDLKIIDAGLAAEGDVDRDVEERGSAVGTPQYMAPEQIRGEPGLISGRTDVYAIGLIAYKLLARQMPLPFGPGDGKSDVRRLICEVEPVKLASLRPFPTTLGRLEPALGELSRVLDVAMRKSPGSTGRSRWDSPSVLGRELRSVLDTGVAGPAPGDSMETATPGPLVVKPKPNEVTGVVAPPPPPPDDPPHARGLVWIGVCGAVAIAAMAGMAIGGPSARTVGLTRVFDRFAFATDAPPQKVALIEVKSKEDISRAAEYVRNQGVEIPGFDPNSPATWRPIWTQLLKMTSTSGAKSVTFDIVMRPRSDKLSNGDPKTPEVMASEQQVDLELRRAADEHPAPVIFAVDGGITNSVQGAADSVRTWSTKINTTIVKWDGPHGATSALCPSDGAWEAELGFERGSRQQIMGLSLATYAAIAFPAATPRFQSDSGGRHVKVDATIDVGDGITKAAGDSQHVQISELATIEHASPDDREAYGLQDGDLVSTMLLRMPSDEALSSVTHSIADVLQPTSDRRSWFNGRAVFIANGIPREDGDVFEYADGRMIHGAWAHAMALEHMMQGQCVRKAGAAAWMGLACAAALFPTLIFGVRRHKWVGRPLIPVGRQYLRQAWGPVLLATLVLGIGAFVLVRLAWFSLPVAPAITSMWLSMLGVAVALRTLVSHTRPERERST